MKTDEVPQDDTPTLGGQRKRLYARTADGGFTTVPSSGWEAEEVVLRQALAEFERRAEDARQRVREGRAAPLEYHMYHRRMDITVLAQSTGFFRWQVRRHLRPRVFARLPRRKLKRYEEALGLTRDELQTLPDEGRQHD